MPFAANRPVAKKGSVMRMAIRLWQSGPDERDSGSHCWCAAIEDGRSGWVAEGIFSAACQGTSVTHAGSARKGPDIRLRYRRGPVLTVSARTSPGKGIGMAI
jgi:hypothetical protein